MRGYRSKPRIVYFQQNPTTGACEEYFYLLLEGIDRLRFETSLVCPQDLTLNSWVNRIEKLGAQVYRYSSDKINSPRILYLYSLFRKLKPDLVHFNDPCLKGIIAARLARVPVLLMTHHTPSFNRQYNFKAKILESIDLRYCGVYFIFTSEFDRDTGIKKDKLDRRRCFVIYYGLPPEKFAKQYNKKEIYDEFSIPRGYYLIGNIGRLNPQKGQIYLIEAASIVIQQFKSVKFLFVGIGKLEHELKDEIQKRGLGDYFIFTGYRTDVTRLLNAFDILVMPSLFEGLCFAVIEASAMGVPVIATAVGGLQRSVMNGKTGILIAPGDPQALAAKIIWMLKHPKEAKEMGSAGKEYFKEMFTQKRMVKKTQELYEKMLSREGMATK